MKKLLSLEEDKLNWKIVLFLILIAYSFNIAVRYIYISYVGDVPQFQWQGHLMINNNDGYYWAEGARDILAGFHQENDSSPITTAPSKLTAFFAYILPFSFETVIFYLPAFFSSLLVIPIILIGRNLGKLEVGFIGALLGSIAWSYYNRTMVGYYDTDMLNIVFPTFLLWSLIWAIRTQEDKYLIFTALDIIAYRWWYPQSYSLEVAFFGLVFLYVAYQYLKKQDFEYNLTLLTFMMFAMMGLDSWIRLCIVICLFILLKFKKEPIFDNFVNELKKEGFFVWYSVVYAPDYGIPQKRKRLVLLASKFGKIELIKATHKPENYITVKKAIGDLEPIKAGETSVNDFIHRASKISDKNLRRIKQSKQGGSWRDWEESLKLKCHTK